MQEPKPGQMIVGGLFEGPAPEGAPQTRALTEAARDLQRMSGVAFSLQVEDGQWSLLADDSPISMTENPDAADLIVDSSVGAPENRLAEALQRFLSGLPVTFREAAFSTVRSRRNTGQKLIETMYLNRGGRVSAEGFANSWTAPAAPATWFSPSVKAALGIVAVLAALALIFSEPIKTSLNAAFGTLEKPRIEASGLEPWIDARVVESTRGHWRLEIVYGPEAPRDLEDFLSRKKAAADRNDTGEWAALEACFQGRLRAEIYGAGDLLLAVETLTLPAPWQERGGSVPLPGAGIAAERISRIVLLP